MALLLLGAIQFASPSRGFADDSTRYKLETAFIFQFTHFIDWTLPAGNKDFVITLLGDSPLQASLKELAEHKTIHGAKLVVRNAADTAALGPCEIVIIAPGQEAALPAVRSKYEGQATLVISDSEGLGEKGSMINFFLEGEKLRFEINRKAVQNQKLKIGSQLLNLAKLIN